MRKITVFLLVVVLSISLGMMTVLTGCVDKAIPKDTQFQYNADEWDVVFEDNFDGDKVDRTKWKVNTMQFGEGNENNGVRRAGYYVDDEDILFVKDGNLTIRTKYKDGKYGAGWYTSWLETSSPKRGTDGSIEKVPADYKSFSSVGGYFEIRCITPPSEGIWSAFWLMPDEGVAFSKDDVQMSGADGVEIDIMESPLYYANRSAVTHVVHGDGYDDRLKSDKSASYKVPNMYSEMHTYALEWTKDKYIFYIDGYKTWETSYQYDGQVLGVSEVAEYMILSIEVGGHRKNGVMYPGIEGDGTPSWAGNPDNNDKTKNYDFVVDYVRVMNRK